MKKIEFTLKLRVIELSLKLLLSTYITNKDMMENSRRNPDFPRFYQFWTKISQSEIHNGALNRVVAIQRWIQVSSVGGQPLTNF